MAISDFPNFWFLTPQNQNFDFSKINAPKHEHFIDIQKTGMYITELCAPSTCTKFQANTFIFGYAIAQKPSNGNDVTFLKLDIWNL